MKNAQIIAEVINTKGYKAEPHDTVKNGITKHGIRISNETNVAPVIYIDNMDGTDEEVADKVISIYENSKTPDFDTTQITNPDYILKNVNVGVQRLQSKADYIHRPTKYEDIEEYLYIRVDENMTFKVTEDLVAMLTKETELLIMADELWDIAYKNTFADYELKSLEEALGLPGMGLPMYYLTNSYKTLGASQLLNDKALTECADKLGADKLYIIPSSIHEVLLIADDGNADVEGLSAMVRAVNSDTVLPEEQLGDNAIVWNR